MSAKDILNSIINNFDTEKFINFFRNKNNNLSYPNETLNYDNKNFTEGKKLAEGELDDGKLIVCSFKVNKDLTERSGKKVQYELGKEILKEQYADAGIFIFYDPQGNFRFSLIYTDYLGKKRDWSSFKRFTYYVSKTQTNKTFLQQVGNADFSTLEKIKEAFSVEPVTKQFYNEIQTWYFWAMDKIKFPKDYKHSTNPAKDEEIRNATNLIRLITRIIFIWFLKEKKLVPSNLFSSEYIKNIIKDFNKNHSSRNYYNAILQNLFFATLNQEMNERKFAKDEGYPANKEEYGVKNLFRYKEKFLIQDEQRILDIFKDIPFLNGGLFDCLDKTDETGKVVYIDGFSRNPQKQAIIPDYLFFLKNEEKINLSDLGLRTKPVRGLFEILNQYNFTVDENTPVDQEVALDPELLGKVFENLLAAYNPETSTTARKATGSYYTPREIVEYMVNESLVTYFKTALQNNTNEFENNIRELLNYNAESNPFENDSTTKQQLIQSIAHIKILDPACGSGAFPMGILHKLVHVLQRIDSDNKLWKEYQYQKAVNETKEVFNQGDKKQREERLNEINETFDESINYPDYSRKLHLIENCIYGVDIQPIAIQISKLRFFISLILEQKIDKTKENFGIRALPNLETKFVSANTLIGLEKPQQLSMRNSDIEKKEEELKQVRHKYFTANTRKKKLEYQRRDKELREELVNLLINDNWGKDVAEKIAKFDLYDQNASADWFDPEWMFGVTDGFDIVIGNPPYVSTKGVDLNSKNILTKQYGFADDLYNHFYFKGIELLKQKGILSYISSKTYWTIQTKKNLREMLLKNKILQIFDTANPFESAMVDTSVILVQKESSNYENEIIFYDGKENLIEPAKYSIKQENYLNAPNQVFFIPTEYNKKIYERFGKKVNELLKQWWDKISTSKNIDKYKRELEKYRNSLKPGDITLLGLITEGGQGLATGNNGKYIGVLEGTKWAENVRKQRPEKLLLASKFCTENNIQNKHDAQNYLNNLSEKEIRELFDTLKKQYGRDIFGQGWLYRIVSPEEIADVNNLKEEEKLNGIEGKKTFVPYDKGDKDGNRWYAPTPYYIDWSKDNVKVLQTDPKARWQGYQFYFKEGFCWSDIHTVLLKARIKVNGIHDVKSMSLFSLLSDIPNWYFICIINSKFISEYDFCFVNNTQTFQINDARQLPVIIPTQEQLQKFESIFNRAYNIQQHKFSNQLSEKDAEKQLDTVQKELDAMVEEMYMG